MDEGTGVINATRPAEPIDASGGGANAKRVIRPATGPHSIDGDAVVTFCRERAERMKHPLTAAIYVGLADRVKRGLFDVKGADNVD